MNRSILFFLTVVLIALQAATGQTFKEYYNSGFEKHSNQNYEEAVKDYTNSIELNDNNRDAYFNRGSCNLAIGNLEEAKFDFDKTVVFINKDTGTEINRIYSSQFVWGDTDENYLLYFSDTTYTEMIFLNHNSDKKFPFDFKSGVVSTSGKENNVLSTNSLFKDFALNGNELIFSFRLDDGSWETKKISIE